MTNSLNAFYFGRRAIVTGATGFLGGWLIKRLLEAGASVACLVRQPRPLSQFAIEGFAQRCEVVHGSCTDIDAVDQLFDRPCDTVFHLTSLVDVNAALATPREAFAASVEATIVLLEQVRKSHPHVTVTVASSDKAYGARPVPFRESDLLAPAHPYEIAKATQDMLARSYGEIHGLNVAVTRCGNYFGGFDFAFERIIPYAIREFVHGRAPVLRSDGHFSRDFIHVEDAAAAHLLVAKAVAENPEIRGQAFNFSYEIQEDIIDLVERIGVLTGSDRRPEIAANAKAEIRHMRLDCAKAREQIGWAPEIGWQDGLSRTVDWYRRYFEQSALMPGLR